MKIIEEKYNWARTNFVTQKPDTIVIHHAAAKSCTAQDIHHWHLERGWMGIAYHYFIRKDGTIYRGRQETWQGGHLYGNENKNTIGICFEGCYTDYGSQTEKSVPDSQINALIELCKDIQKRWPIKAIKRHADYPSAQSEKKDCPGKYFPWVEFISRLGGINLSVDWNAKNKEFIKKVQQTIGCKIVDGLAGNETEMKFQEFVAKAQSNDKAEAIKKAWNTFIEAIK